jgi:DNA-binding transcriptional ArsR family regulator
MMTDKKQSINAETTWFHLFRSMIFDGNMKKMGLSAFGIYCTIKAHVDFSTGSAFPSIERICELTGLTKRTVLRNLSILEDMGFVVKEKKGRKNVYTLRERFDILDDLGRPSAVATWDYLPRSVQAAQAELKNFLLTGKSDGTIIHIERLNLQVNLGGTNKQENFDISSISDPNLKKQIERLEALRNRCHESTQSE